MNSTSFFQDEQCLDGELLENYVINKESLSLYEIYKITLNLCNIIESFHKEDFFIVLRELNPRNIIVMENNQVKIIKKSHYLHMLHNKNESLRNYKLWKLSKQNDLRNIGKIMYFMATGKLPRTVLDVFINDNYPDNMNENFKDIIHKCFEGYDKNTYYSVQEISKEISTEILKYIKRKEIMQSNDLNVESQIVRQRRRVKTKSNKIIDFYEGLPCLKDFMIKAAAKDILVFVRNYIL